MEAKWETRLSKRHRTDALEIRRDSGNVHRPGLYGVPVLRGEVGIRPHP